ncbi:MAG: winged helix-turn-helix transcriptional regulator [Candidatus Marsarchaeota archaeon]|jgi:DNA-binding HxlR family transcriptional regulator|nr:winged helix-turn-helix transcriptional regulator [Candidatus Marsarchaeota archaeon]
MVELFKKDSSAKKHVISIVRSNWQSSILAILNSEKEGLSYNELISVSGLSPKTLSMILKKLASNGLVTRETLDNSITRVKYKITKRGSAMISTNCPLIFVRAKNSNSGFVYSAFEI